MYDSLTNLINLTITASSIQQCCFHGQKKLQEIFERHNPKHIQKTKSKNLHIIFFYLTFHQKKVLNYWTSAARWFFLYRLKTASEQKESVCCSLKRARVRKSDFSCVSLTVFLCTGPESGWGRLWRGGVGGASLPLSRGAAGQGLPGCHGARQARPGGPEGGVPVRQAPVAGPQGESSPWDACPVDTSMS